MNEDLRNLVYLFAAILFIVGIKGLTHPRTAVRGNLLGAMGMLLAAVVTVLDQAITGWGWIVIGLIIGTGIGAVLAQTIKMTAMPQLVAVFNGFGGLASFLVAGAAVHGVGGLMIEEGTGAIIPTGEVMSGSSLVAVAVSGIIGAVTLSGSLLAFAKLQEMISGNPVTTPVLKIANALCAVGAIACAILYVAMPEQAWAYWLLVGLALAVGVFLVMPIGGADMPVVISLLNSYSGLAAAATGFVISNNVLIIAGSLVGAAGLILTKIMCVAMNRSLTNVLFGLMAEGGTVMDQDEVYAGKIKATSAEEAAMLFETARRVCIIPGYGMAVAQAQHAVRDLANELQKRGATVEFGVHPVAGRMPGHMNVLLAEADVPYDQLKEMDEVNSSMDQVDIALVLGANDTVNPSSRDDPNSPIAGMPIIEADRAGTVIVVKRSLSPGFAGIPNPLFAADNCLMLFGDGKQAMLDVVGSLE